MSVCLQNVLLERFSHQQIYVRSVCLSPECLARTFLIVSYLLAPGSLVNVVEVCKESRKLCDSQKIMPNEFCFSGLCLVSIFSMPMTCLLTQPHTQKDRHLHTDTGVLSPLQTYIGNVVVSVNPYEKLPLYTHAVIEEYRSRNIYELPPHM